MEHDKTRCISERFTLKVTRVDRTHHAQSMRGNIAEGFFQSLGFVFGRFMKNLYGRPQGWLGVSQDALHAE